MAGSAVAATTAAAAAAAAAMAAATPPPTSAATAASAITTTASSGSTTTTTTTSASSTTSSPPLHPLTRSVSQQSGASLRSHRSRAPGGRGGRKRPSRNSSCASYVIAAEDKSLTSFPSFSSGAPTDEEEPEPAPEPEPEPAEADDGPLVFSAASTIATTTTATTISIAEDDLRDNNPSSSSSSSALPTPTPTPRTGLSGSGLLEDFYRAIVSPGSMSAGGMSPHFLPQRSPTPAVASAVTATGAAAAASRDALFDDSPPLLATNNIPGALHHADDAHIERLVARHGAVGLVRLLAGDLARRDGQMAALRRRADERERALRKIILLECGLSSLELETRLRSVEAELRANETVRIHRPAGNGAGGGGGDDGVISDLVSDAMSEEVGAGGWAAAAAAADETEATIRARGPSSSGGGGSGDPKPKGWKTYFWGGGGGGGVTRSAASSVSGDAARPHHHHHHHNHHGHHHQTIAVAGGRPGLRGDLFEPPPPVEELSARSSSQSSASRKTSLASLALRLVAGGVISSREGDSRGRPAGTPPSSARGRSSSTMTAHSGRTVSAQGGPRSLMAMRRSGPPPIPTTAPRTAVVDRWDSMVSSPPAPRQESYGPVEMDTILPPEGQPPTLSQNNYYYGTGNGSGGGGGSGSKSSSEFLTDRFGFIYDQRRRRRQKEASVAQISAQAGGGGGGSGDSDLEIARPGASPISRAHSPDAAEPPAEGLRADDGDGEENFYYDEGKQSGARWQDYLRIPTTFPAELLAHTPSIMGRRGTAEEHQQPLPPRSPGLTMTGERAGFLPAAGSAATAAPDGGGDGLEPDGDVATPSGTLVREDAEPVRILLRQLGEVHDALQRERTTRWNEFLRKVRAERRREGEAAAAAAAAAAEARFEPPAMILPEAKLHDGEMVGVAGLGVKGRVGRAKWKEFMSLVLGGIPVTYRAKIWAECTGAATLRAPGHYGDLVARPASDDDAAVAAQIRMDTHRTLTDNIFFRCGPGVGRLHEVLLAYARRNPGVGYCQGMNLIAANLLLVTPSAEDAFWILASMVENILPAGYYDGSLLTSRADQRVLRRYVAAVLPRLSRHLDELGIELEALTFQWFLSVFTDCLSAEALFRVWDVILCGGGDGSTFLFRVALALLKLNEPQLLRCDTPAAAYTYINHQMTNHAISIDGLVRASEALRPLVRKEDVEARREAAIEEERETARQRRRRRRRRSGGDETGGEGEEGSRGGSSSSSSHSEGGDELAVRAPMPMDQEVGV